MADSTPSRLKEKILIVDDDVTSRLMIEFWLECEGIDCVGVGDAEPGY